MPDKLPLATGVRLDLAKDCRMSAVLTVVEQPAGAGTIELIMPQTAQDEFTRNPQRVVEQSRRSLSSPIKRVREPVAESDQQYRRSKTLRELGQVEHKMVMNGEASRGMEQFRVGNDQWGTVANSLGALR